MRCVLTAPAAGIALMATGCQPAPATPVTPANAATSRPGREPVAADAPPATPVVPERVTDASALPSMPRVDWPCRIDVEAIDSVTWTFRYEGPKQCWLPMELHAEGVVGCATRVDVVNEAADYEQSYELRYDERGRLVEKEGPRKLTYTWDEHRVRSDNVFDYVVDGSTVRKVVRSSGKVGRAGVVRSGRLTRFEYREGDQVTGVADFRWQGTQLVSFATRSEVLENDVTTHVARYDCD